MSERTRGRAFDEALRRTLRRWAETLPMNCPEPDLLAAYLEHSLSPDEIAQLDSHVSACSRCREILSAVAAEELNSVEHALVASPARPTTASIPAASGRDRSGALPRAVAALRLRPQLNWRWLAPAALAAAAVVLWVIMRPVPTTQQARLSSDRIASLTAPPTERSLPATNEQAPPEPMAKTGPEKKPTSTLTPSTPSSAVAHLAGRAKKADVDRSSRENAKASELAKAAPGTSLLRSQPTDVPSRLSSESSRAEQDQLARMRDPSVQAPPTPPAYEKQEELSKSKEQAETVKLGPSPKARSDRDSKESKDRDPDAAVAQATGAISIGAYRTQDSAISQRSLALGIPPIQQVSAPGSTTLWRFGPAGLIERSLDAGQSWQRQASHVTADLLAGSTPLENVCWIVGRAGTILRTTDGVAWERMPSPEPSDWVSVAASSALVATITSRESRRYSTADGGRIWRRQ